MNLVCFSFFLLTESQALICSAYLLASTKGLGDVAFCEKVGRPEPVCGLPLGLASALREEWVPGASWHG